MDNTMDGTNPNDTGGVLLKGSGTTQMLIANNISHDNDQFDLCSTSTDHIFLLNNNVQKTSGSAPFESFNNMGLPPGFFLNQETFEPDLNSPLVGAGVNPCGFVCPFPLPFKNNWEHPEYDLKGQLMEQGSRIDIGAVESVHEPGLIFWGRFE